MRKFKNIAVASATALALTVSGTTVANAAEVERQELSTTSSAWGTWLNGDEAATGEAGFGETLDSEAPAWIKAWNVGLQVLAGGTIIGAIIAGFNKLKHDGIII